MSTIGDDLLRPASPEFGPASRRGGLQQQPGGGGARVGQGGAGFAREDLFTVVLEQFQTDTADYADYVLPATTQLEHWDIHTSYGHTDVLLNRPASRRSARRAPTPQVFRELAARMGFDDPAFATSDESLCRRPSATASTSGAAGAGLRVSLQVPDAPFAEGRFPTASGRCEFFSARLARPGLDGLPDHVPNYEPAGQLRALPAGDDLAAGAQLPQLHLRQRAEPARHRGRAAAGMHADDAAARGIVDRQVVRVFNDRGEYRCKARCRARAAGRRQRPGHLVAQARAGRHQRQPAHQPAPDRPGPRPVFYDCLVEVQA
jgi:anaerobic selenocysteine-containing dehydrogenase